MYIAIHELLNNCASHYSYCRVNSNDLCAHMLQNEMCIRDRVSTVPLIPRRDMRKLRGTYMDVTAKDHYTAENKMDYLQITLTDEEDVPGALQKLRTVYPNLMRLEYDNKRTRENREVQAVEAQEQKSELQLFEEFYELLNNEPMKEEQTEFVEKLIQDLKEVRV